MTSSKPPVVGDTQAVEATQARLRWRCRRGTRELDALMLGWLHQHYPVASESEQQAFSDMLDMQDPDLMKLIISGDSSDNQNHMESAQLDAHATVLDQIRNGERTES